MRSLIHSNIIDRSSHVRHVPKQSPFNARPQIRILHFIYTVHRPPHQLWNLNKAGLAALAVHDHDNEVKGSAATLEADRETGARRRRYPGLDAGEGAHCVVRPEHVVGIFPHVVVGLSYTRWHFHLLCVANFLQKGVFGQRCLTQ